MVDVDHDRCRHGNIYMWVESLSIVANVLYKSLSIFSYGDVHEAHEKKDLKDGKLPKIPNGNYNQMHVLQ